jgi:hypothetical protein
MTLSCRLARTDGMKCDPTPRQSLFANNVAVRLCTRNHDDANDRGHAIPGWQFSPTMTPHVNGNGHWQSTLPVKPHQYAPKSTSSRVAMPASKLKDLQPTPTSAPNDPPDGIKDIYDATLPWWRAAIRRRLIQLVERETRLIARMQVRVSSSEHTLALTH